VALCDELIGDTRSFRADFGGVLIDESPTIRAKKGSKRHLLVDGHGVSLAVRMTGAQRHDSLEALPAIHNTMIDS